MRTPQRISFTAALLPFATSTGMIIHAFTGGPAFILIAFGVLSW